MEKVKKFVILGIILIFAVGLVRVAVTYVPKFLSPVIILLVVVMFSFMLYNAFKSD